MSTDVIVDALLGFATCESSIKSFSQILKSLHSIDSLHRLKEKADVVELLLVIASFAPLFAPPPPPAPPTIVVDDGTSVDARLERFERRAETSRRNRLAVAEGLQDDMVAFTHTPALSHPPILEDGRDDGVLLPEEVLSSSQLVFGTSSQRADPLKHLIHPERQSELTPFAPKEKPLYSFLIHFPVFSAVGAKLSVVDRAELFSLPVMQKWGFGNSMATFAYPRLRLTNGGIACIVVDDDLGRLEGIRKDLEEAERELLDKSATRMLDRTFFLVGTWKDEHVSLAFSISSNTASDLGICPTLRRWADPGNLWKYISEIYPILSDYQKLAHGQEGGKPLLGAGLCYHSHLYAYDHDVTVHYLTLVFPLLWSPHALMFANDFATQHSPLSLISNFGGTKYEAYVRVVKMGPPALKDDGNWDGPVLRNDYWLARLDDKFGLS